MRTPRCWYVYRVAADTDIDAWLEGEGIVERASRVEAMVVLAAAGLTRAGKQRMANHKLEAARRALWAGVTPVCADAACRTAAGRPALPIVTTTRERCSVCGGSNTKRAVKTMVDACRKAGLKRVLVLGGSKAAHTEIRDALAGSRLEVRMIHGLDGSPSSKAALPDLEWAQLLVVWASTALPHRVSQAYTEQRPRDLPQVTLARRSVEALCMEITRFASGDPLR